jgi:hypothetical protein
MSDIKVGDIVRFKNRSITVLGVGVSGSDSTVMFGTCANGDESGYTSTATREFKIQYAIRYPQLRSVPDNIKLTFFNIADCVKYDLESCVNALLKNDSVEHEKMLMQLLSA